MALKPTPTTSFETITPEIAAIYLGMNRKNQRRISKVRVEQYAKSMRDGVWPMNGESIIFDENGELCNGQHRLTACIVAGVPFQSLVVRGIPVSWNGVDVITTMDDLRARRAPDALQVSLATKSASYVASAARLQWRYDNDGWSQRSTIVLSNRDVVEIVKKNPGMVDACSMNKLFRWNTCPTSTAWVLYRAMLEDRDLALVFFGSLSTGVNLEADDPALLTRNKIIRMASVRSNKLIHGSTKKVRCATILAKGWRLWMRGAKRTDFKLRRHHTPSNFL